MNGKNAAPFGNGAAGSPSSRRFERRQSTTQRNSSSNGHWHCSSMRFARAVSTSSGPGAPSGVARDGCGRRRRIVPRSPGFSPMPVLTLRFFVKLAEAWSAESESAPPLETCIVRRSWRSGERFSTSTASHLAPERSSERRPSGGSTRRPQLHSALRMRSRTVSAPSRTTSAPWTGTRRPESHENAGRAGSVGFSGTSGTSGASGFSGVSGSSGTSGSSSAAGGGFRLSGAKCE